jgi:hypothetical protein
MSLIGCAELSRPLSVGVTPIGAETPHCGRIGRSLVFRKQSSTEGSEVVDLLEPALAMVNSQAAGSTRPARRPEPELREFDRRFRSGIETGSEPVRRNRQWRVHCKDVANRERFLTVLVENGRVVLVGPPGETAVLSAGQLVQLRAVLREAADEAER